MVSFDPYLNWLGIPPHEQPPNFYRLLGVVLFESNPGVIERAADRQSWQVGAYQSGPQGNYCQQLLSEIAMARFCLLDPQQKAAYDGQLQQGLAQRGERAVAAPPPPAVPEGPQQFGPRSQQFAPPPQQFGPQSPQFVPQAGMGPVHPGFGMPRPMSLPGPPPPHQMPGFGAMPRPAAMSIPMAPPQPVMQMPATMMPAPAGFAPAMPHPPAPAAIPLAAPFAVAVPSPNVAPPAAGPAAPPVHPPTAPQRPIDELESLTSQPTRRHFPKKKKKTDYTTEIIFGGVLTATGILLFMAYAAFTNRDGSKHGFDTDLLDKGESYRAARDSAEKMLGDLRKRDKERQKEK